MDERKRECVYVYVLGRTSSSTQTFMLRGTEGYRRRAKTLEMNVEGVSPKEQSWVMHISPFRQECSSIRTACSIAAYASQCVLWTHTFVEAALSDNPSDSETTKVQKSNGRNERKGGVQE